MCQARRRSRSARLTLCRMSFSSRPAASMPPRTPLLVSLSAAPLPPLTGEGSPTVSSYRSETEIPRTIPQLDAESTGTRDITDDGGDEDDGFGDDFDEFEEGQEDFGE